MERHFTLYRLLKRLFWWLLPLALVGWLVGALWPALALALAATVLWNVFYFQRLNRWLWQSRTMLPPRAPGAWSDIYDGIYRTLRRAQLKRRQLSILLQRFRQAAEAIPDAALVLESDGTLVWSNKLAQIYFGLRWPTDRGIRITNLIRYPRFIKYFEISDFAEPITILAPAGDQREIEMRFMPYTDTQLLVIARDITQLRKLERLRKDFVANVSHELKTPLTVMNGYLELLEEPLNVPPEMLTKALHDMTLQNQRMQKMVEQLLTLSRMEGQSQDTFTRKVVMSELINQVIQELQPIIAAKGLALQLDVADGISVLGNEEKLRAACSNLITNAIKYGKENGHLRVTWLLVGQFAEFSVEDDGPGIAAEHVPRLTERFYRVEKDRNSATGGTGLGLSIVKHALEHHRSYLQVESAPNQGSRFFFRIVPELLVSE
ncbi:phosphate regulon sensor histidine kinase PhoR [Aliidiomarina haloalkalitolerans]|uniref:Phosphate regulon sensor protein PhoR n=1 Tax=Aliidiomarina haloalkalitolerans TaxID=859059 RepID=A0A432VTY3_9GAMM|nr:phosphate regulon sensor histidine kinase PhoR [Aliidiomarina haloalkalitolerans]MCL4409436.1 phosphate regulon sensor histidine kinase PhoR [Gammaproteobacteria bacterium]RUO19869.1 two-component system sensor histidine kinase PhoR [Aliidiomarina haloalkalitolerans]